MFLVHLKQPSIDSDLAKLHGTRVNTLTRLRNGNIKATVYLRHCYCDKTQENWRDAKIVAHHTIHDLLPSLNAITHKIGRTCSLNISFTVMYHTKNFGMDSAFVSDGTSKNISSCITVSLQIQGFPR